MSCQLGHVLGREADFYVTPQTGLTLALPVAGPPTNVAGGAVHILGSDFPFDQAQEPREDASSGRDHHETVPGKITGNFTIEMNLVPPTALTSRPDAHHLLVAALGTHTFNSGTNTIYNLTNGGLCIPLSLYRRFNRNQPLWMEAARFALVEEFKISGKGSEAQKMVFTGRFAQHIGTANSLITTGSATTTQNVTAGTGVGGASAQFEVDSRVMIGAQTNGGVGYRVTGGTANTIILDIAPTLTVTGDIVAPFAPAPTLSTQPVLGFTQGSVTFFGTQIPIEEWEITVKNNLKFVDGEYGQLYLTDAMPEAKRDIMFSMKMRARADLVGGIVARKGLATGALSITAGLGAGRLWTAAAPRIKPNTEGLNVAGVAAGEIPLTGRMLASTQNATDAFSLTCA
jgi:hypothetical protein